MIGLVASLGEDRQNSYGYGSGASDDYTTEEN